MSKKGIRIWFNKYNTYGSEPCCCQKKYYTKFGVSTFFCIICNIFCCRRLFKMNSFCKKHGYYDTCTTCQQYGEYELFGKGVISKFDD